MHGSSVINEWGLGFSYKEEDGSHIIHVMVYYVLIYGLFRHIDFFSCLAKIASVV